MMKKKIGISYTRTNFHFYWNWFEAADLGDDIELVELSFERNNQEEIETCDAFVLMGGIDIHPSIYGEDFRGTEKTEIARDLFEKKIFDYSQLHSLPLLAICRGMQLVNVLQGGKLIQDLGKMNDIHRKAETDKRHRLRVKENSLLQEVTDDQEGTINSAHHQAVDSDRLGKNLEVGAFGIEGDSVAESLEFADKSGKAFMLCVQWHPERMEDRQKNHFSINIKNRFLDEVRKSATPKLRVINPATEETIKVINEDTEKSILAKYQLLREGQSAWALVPVKERVECIRKFATSLEEEKEELGKTLTTEMGKPLQESFNELKGAKAKIQFFIDNSEKWLQEEWITKEGSTREKIVYEPLGVVANISAWNYPYLVAINVVIPALIGGNAIFYKPSEFTILTGMHIQKMMYEAGVGEHCFELAIGKGHIGAALLQLPLKGYFFTGSYKTGKHIAQQIAHKLVPCQLELGGKDPLYVMDDIEDIDKVAAAALEGVVYNNGQSCCAVERIYVHENIYDVFVQSYVDLVKKLVIGNPLNKETEIGSLSRKEQVDFLLEQIEEAVQKGAKVLYGGNKLYNKGYFIEPTVLINVNHEMKIMKEESFGPVIGIQKVKNDEEALELMQDTEFGLTAAVYSKSYERAEKIMKQMDTGTVYWNCCDRVSAALPWSGRKHSGLGTTLSYQGIRAFVKPKAYHIRG